MRLDRQVSQAAEEAISELPAACDRCIRMNAKGKGKNSAEFEAVGKGR